MAGHAQKALVARLQQCSNAVVIIDNIDAAPTAVLPVLITALSEHGHFEHSRHQIDTTKALYVGILQVPPSLLQQVGLLKTNKQGSFAQASFACDAITAWGRSTGPKTHNVWCCP